MDLLFASLSYIFLVELLAFSPSSNLVKEKPRKFREVNNSAFYFPGYFKD